MAGGLPYIEGMAKVMWPEGVAEVTNGAQFIIGRLETPDGRSGSCIGSLLPKTRDTAAQGHISILLVL